jgi:hypothetical protein
MSWRTSGGAATSPAQMLDHREVYLMLGRWIDGLHGRHRLGNALRRPCRNRHSLTRHRSEHVRASRDHLARSHGERPGRGTTGRHHRSPTATGTSGDIGSGGLPRPLRKALISPRTSGETQPPASDS